MLKLLLNFYSVNRKYFHSIIVWLITILLICWLVFYIKNENEKLATLLNLNFTQIILLSFICLILFIPKGLIRKLMAQRLGVHLVFIDWYGLFMVTNFISLIIPARGDFVFSAAYLKRKYELPFSKFGSMIYGNAILLAIVLSLEASLGLLLLGIIQGTWNFKVFGIVIAIGFGALPFALLSRSYIQGENLFVKKLKNALEGWEQLRSDKKLLLKSGLLVVTNSLIFTIWMYASYQVLGFNPQLIPVFFAGVVTQMSFFFSLTPGNLGVRETIVGFVSQVTGLGFTEGVAVTILQRVISMAIFFIAGSFFSLFIINDLLAVKKNLEAKEQDETAN